MSQFGTGVAEMYRAMTGGEGDMVRGLENTMPAAIRNAMKSLRFAHDNSSVETRRRDVITGDLGASDLLGQALGFRPNEVSLQQDLNQMKVRIDKNVAAKRQQLSKRYYLALRVGDVEEARAVLEDIQAFNESVRERFPNSVIDRDYLERSLKSHLRTTKEMSSGVSLAPGVRDALNDLEGMYDRGFQLFQ
jgi:hypothetical protein